MSPDRRNNARLAGQTTIETTLLLGAAVIAFVTMSLYVQRAYQGYLYTNASAHGSGFNPKRGYLEIQELAKPWDGANNRVIPGGQAFRQIQNLKNEQEGPGGTAAGAAANLPSIPSGSVPGRVLRVTVDSTVDWSVNHRTCDGNPAPCEPKP